MMSINIKSEVEHRQQISIKLLICFVWVVMYACHKRQQQKA